MESGTAGAWGGGEFPRVVGGGRLERTRIAIAWRPSWKPALHPALRPQPPLQRLRLEVWWGNLSGDKQKTFPLPAPGGSFVFLVWRRRRESSESLSPAPRLAPGDLREQERSDSVRPMAAASRPATLAGPGPEAASRTPSLPPAPLATRPLA